MQKFCFNSICTWTRVYGIIIKFSYIYVISVFHMATKVHKYNTFRNWEKIDKNYDLGKDEFY